MHNSMLFRKFIELCTQHRDSFRTLSPPPKVSLYPLFAVNHYYPPAPQQPLICFVSLYSCLFSMCYICEIIEYTVLYAGILSLSKCLRFNYVVAFTSSILLFIDDYYMFIHSPIDGHLNYFQFGAMMHNVTMNIHIHVLVWIYVFTKNLCFFSPSKLVLFLSTIILNFIGVVNTHRK